MAASFTLGSTQSGETDLSEPPTIRHVQTPVHGRCLIRKPREGHSARGLLIGFHGYAESAEDAMADMQTLSVSDSLVLAAPMALHHFYAPRQGRVVASWMTSLDREKAIGDCIEYIRRIVDAVTEEADGKHPLFFYGFSQGGQAACRAAWEFRQTCRGLIVLGSDLPPERKQTSLAGFPRLLLLRGRDDRFYDASKYDADLEALSAAGVSFSREVYEGGHGWTDEARRIADEFLQDLIQNAP